MIKCLTMLFSCLMYVQLFAQNKNDSSNVDSIINRYLLFNGTISASYIDQRNWQENQGSVVSLLSSATLRERIRRVSGREFYYFLRTELSYVKYSDSLWIKNNDYLRMQFYWIEPQGKKLTHSYSIIFGTQWLNNWNYILTDTGYRKYWNGGIMNPAFLDLNYGIHLDLWNNSSLDIAFASIRIKSKPKTEFSIPTLEKNESILITPQSTIQSLYGFNAQLDIREDLYENIVLIENNSQLFFNAINRVSVNFDFNNRIALRFLKFMQLRFDSHVLYDPDYSTKIQYRQEVLLGVFYEHRKLRNK